MVVVVVTLSSLLLLQSSKLFREGLKIQKLHFTIYIFLRKIKNDKSVVSPLMCICVVHLRNPRFRNQNLASFSLLRFLPLSRL